MKDIVSHEVEILELTEKKKRIPIRSLLWRIADNAKICTNQLWSRINQLLFLKLNTSLLLKHTRRCCGWRIFFMSCVMSNIIMWCTITIKVQHTWLRSQLFTSRSNHVDVYYHCVWDVLEKKLLWQKAHTNENRLDVMTKVKPIKKPSNNEPPSWGSETPFFINWWTIVLLLPSSKSSLSMCHSYVEYPNNGFFYFLPNSF